MKGVTTVLFLCMSRVCRSPLAETILTDLIKERGIADKWVVHSCGTAMPRNIIGADYFMYDYILCIMHVHEFLMVQRRKPKKAKAKVFLLWTFDRLRARMMVDDPQRASPSASLMAMEESFIKIMRSCRGFLDRFNSSSTVP